MENSTRVQVRRRTLVATVLAGVALPFGLTACQSDRGASGTSSSEAPSTPPATITVSPAGTTGEVRPDTPITVTAAGGTLTDVVVTAGDGTPLAGALDPAGTTWTSTAALAPATTYAVHAAATNAAGTASNHDASLTTLTPAETAFPAVAPLTGSEVGVGMPIVVTFDSPIADDKRAVVEQRLVVTASPTPVTGSWSWQSDSVVQFRPEQYWPAHTQVHLDVDLGAVEVSPGVWGKTRDIDFTVGSATISTVDIAAHTLTVTRDGQVLRTIPVTTGQSGSGGRFVTRSGTKVIMSLEESREMNSETTGIGQDDPDYYNVDVQYAMRLTNSGEFLHAAPWSVSSQGRANVSHGCTGMSTADAQWMFQNSKVGDVVTYTGSDRVIEPGNGFNVWNETYEQWRRGSALPA
ncbi:L,D-transpeptidase [Kineococcus radiotolerans]|uniref:ErfK/YbiS/YcfS/YnhG family protein n=1 Tax=Kineococcus radiotolerans (strain ATCC BAA-149 / DSM 14245 / SRS30216) TaxID=266940 RepID=A6WD31_KINRD|nr:Ig-like domain-containing protein [Kineococcus radiotolerans]ABS04720.1 ErfK/YbiS/YcfS/YnhG family protein [Kineococcus radiotolerans SRS30216 = ATCC BAA-149]